MRMQFRISEVSRNGETAYVIRRCLFGFLWLRQRIPAIYFGFPFDWWRSFSVFDSEDDAEDALFSYLNKKYPETDYTIHVRELRWLQPAELFASEHIRKWGRNRRSGSFDSNSKICYNCVWLSWERSTPLHSGVSHTH